MSEQTKAEAEQLRFGSQHDSMQPENHAAVDGAASADNAPVELPPTNVLEGPPSQTATPIPEPLQDTLDVSREERSAVPADQTIDLSQAQQVDSVAALTFESDVPPAEKAGGALDSTVDFSSVDSANAEAANASAPRTISNSQFPDTSLAEADSPSGGGDWPTVAGYQLLGELGRGGMGVVYKARQRGLRRLVALKMVLAGAHAGPRQLERFHTEAEAVARLQHPNIVQIYEVGEENGLPFFSLEFVDGSSLDKKIAGKAQPAREAARLTATLARAMHFAHERGILHRDLKPGNILLTRDGVPKITDFGLAKRLEEGNQSSTKTGTIMGTPSYMSPEQAHGLVHELTPLADLYSLGAMLYEFLTGRPPFVGLTPMDTVVLVTKEEPVPPGRLQPGLPVDLETICLKCLQKEPEKRYANCFELAQDLDRFLAGEPIQARPIGQLERFVRWCKRNPRTAGMAAAIFVLLVAGVIISSASAVMIAGERNQKEEERQAAEEARKIASQERNQKELERQAAEEARGVATEQVALALDTVKTLIHKVQDQLENAPRTQPLKKALLQTAADGLEQISQRAKGNTSTEVAIAFAAVRMKMGLVYRQLGETEEAFKHVLESHRINQEQARAQPDSNRAKRNLAASYTVLAEMSLELRRDLAASLDCYEKALFLREDLYRHPQPGEDEVTRKSVKQGLAETYVRVGATRLRMGDPRKARDEFQKALPLREELAKEYPRDDDVLQDLARSYHAVGEMSLRLGETAVGKQYFGECLKLREHLFQAHKDNPKFKLELARWCATLGEVAERSHDYQEALRHYQRSVDLDRELLESDPKNVDYERELGTAYYQLATTYLQRKDAAGADKYFHECLKIRQARAAAEPQNSRRQMELIGVLPHCGEHRKAAEAAEKLRQAKPKDQEILIAIGCCYACCSAVPGARELRQQYVDKSLEALNQSIALGFKDVSFFTTDPDLDPIRSEPGFQKLLQKLKGAKG
jgi:eukaryotic-like serine/threonine-protein kinase